MLACEYRDDSRSQRIKELIGERVRCTTVVTLSKVKAVVDSYTVALKL